MKLKLTESEFVSWIKEVVKEQYDRQKLYEKSEILRQLKDAPVEIKRIARNLPDIPCENEQGIKTVCTKIPEVIHVYLTGRY
jgi:hypothetical protein